MEDDYPYSHWVIDVTDEVSADDEDIDGDELVFKRSVTFNEFMEFHRKWPQLRFWQCVLAFSGAQDLKLKCPNGDAWADPFHWEDRGPWSIIGE